MALWQQIGKVGRDPLADQLGSGDQAAGATGSRWALRIVAVGWLNGKELALAGQAGEGADSSSVEMDAQGGQRFRIDPHGQPSLLGRGWPASSSSGW